MMIKKNSILLDKSGVVTVVTVVIGEWLLLCKLDRFVLFLVVEVRDRLFFSLLFDPNFGVFNPSSTVVTDSSFDFSIFVFAIV